MHSYGQGYRDSDSIDVIMKAKHNSKKFQENRMSKSHTCHSKWYNDSLVSNIMKLSVKK